MESDDQEDEQQVEVEENEEDEDHVEVEEHMEVEDNIEEFVETLNAVTEIVTCPPNLLLKELTKISQQLNTIIDLLRRSVKEGKEQ